MSVVTWTYILVGLTFSLYIGIAIWARAGSTKEFYVAGGGVSPLANGLATAADWMSAASFLGMAGLISFKGYSASTYLMGWTGGYVLLALLLAPYLRKFGKFTTPDFMGDRYYSQVARVVAVFCAIFISFTYVAGQMRGVGIVFSNFLNVDINSGVVIGMIIVFFYAVLGGMKGITYTQVAQYCVLIFAFMVPAIFISIYMTNYWLPQLGLGATVKGENVYLLDKIDQLHKQLGFSQYTELVDNAAENPDGLFKAKLNMFFLTAALMCGTAGLPHVIVRFFTVPKVSDARKSAFWALLFIAILYTSAPAVAVFARTNLLTEIIQKEKYSEMPGWFKRWENTGLIAWLDKNNDGKVQYTNGDAFKPKKPKFKKEGDAYLRGDHGQKLVTNAPVESNSNELYIDRDIMVLANPEIAKLPNWVVALVAAGGLAAALSTAAGLLLVISTSVSHDLLKKWLHPEITEKQELFFARLAAAGAVIVAGYFGINPPGFVAQVVAFAFGLAASTIFPAIVMGIFSKKINREGAIVGMLVGLLFTASYIIAFKFGGVSKEHLFFGIAPEGIGTIGMVLNFVTAIIVSKFTPETPKEVQELVEAIRLPRGAGDAVDH